MPHLEAEWPSKQNILIADTILAEPGPWLDFKVRRENAFLGGKIFVFTICLKQIFLSTTNFGEAQKRFGGNCPLMPSPVSAGLGRTVARKSSISGLHVCAGRQDILKIYI